jgi:hypothetical protein
MQITTEHNGLLRNIIRESMEQVDGQQKHFDVTRFKEVLFLHRVLNTIIHRRFTDDLEIPFDVLFTVAIGL